MPEPTSPSPKPAADPVAPAPKTQPRGYFNQAQLEDIEIAEEIIPPAQDPSRTAALTGKDITPAYITGLGDAVKLARGQISDTDQAAEKRKTATLNAGDAERDLVTLLQAIQSAAKQKHRMLAEDDDSATDFPTDGYLIGLRLNPNRSTFLQNAATLQGKAKTDALPSFKTPESLAAIQTAIDTYKHATATQAERDEEAAADRIARDKLVRKINSRRRPLALHRRRPPPPAPPLQAPARSALQWVGGMYRQRHIRGYI